MGLESALVDRARIVSQQATGVRTRGMSQMAPVTGPWFAALLQLPQSPSNPDSSQGRSRVVRSPTLLFDVIDEENNTVVVTAAVRLEVESDRFGTSLWEPTGDPEPLATLYETLGFQVTIRQVADHEFAQL